MRLQYLEACCVFGEQLSLDAFRSYPATALAPLLVVQRHHARCSSVLSAWPSKDPDAVRYLDFCATTVSICSIWQPPAPCGTDTQQR